MRVLESWCFATRFFRAWAWVGAVAVVGGGSMSWADEAPSKDRADLGRELFLREWTPGDARSHGGDGLGPVFNDSSCVACHNAGGAGGAGPASKNVDIISAFSNTQNFPPARREGGGFLAKAAEAVLGIEPPKMAAPRPPRKPDTTELIKSHAGFRSARSVVLHRFGTEDGYEEWRANMLGIGQFMNNFAVMNLTGEQRAAGELQRVRTLNQFKGQNFQGQAGEFSLLHSQRNPTALFGAGLIDSIPESVLVATAREQEKADPSTAGRVAMQKDGKIGRFGWKAQTPSLSSFVRTACAVELGLEVPGHSQGGLPQKPDYKAKGADMDDAECDALTTYVKTLARPVEISAHDADVQAGKALFARVGCTSCHMAKLGEVDGIYSDLLVHDLGPDLGDTGQYGVFTPNSSDPDFEDDAKPTTPIAGEVAISTGPAAFAPLTPPVEATATTVRIETVAVSGGPVPAMAANTTPKAVGPAGRQEWRTPPLWGLRDSGPYLHDGRADTIDQAIAFHGGQGTKSAGAFFALSPKEKKQMTAFLKTLVAPMDGTTASK